MAYEQFRIYGYNHGTEPEHYRLHVRDHRTEHTTPRRAHYYDAYQSSPGADYIDRARMPRPDDHIGPYVESARRSRRKNTGYSTQDYISPPVDARDDYIDQDYHTPARAHAQHTPRHQNVPGGFYEDEYSPSMLSISAKEQDSIHRIMKEAKFGNHHEIMRAYWVPQEYDEMPVDQTHSHRQRSRSVPKLEPRRVRYDSESETDVQTYVGDSGDDEVERPRLGGWNSDEDSIVETRDRWRSKSLRSDDVGRAPSPHMPGGYASSSPSIHYESDEEDEMRHRSRKASRERAIRRYASSSPNDRHRDSSASPSAHHYASSSPAPSEWGQYRSRRHISFSSSTDHARQRSMSSPPTRPHASSSLRPRIQRAPSPPPAIARRYSSSSTLSPYVGSDYDAPVRYESDTGDDDDTCVSGSERGRYVRSEIDSDVCSDFVINGGSDCDFEGDDIWNDSGSEGEYDDE
ncbi:hypothetical protein HBI80_244200 [Parastagonospora nodorum]|nr:hypothetical protein HBI80_244200 [Parastagonospora nodorum]